MYLVNKSILTFLATTVIFFIFGYIENSEFSLILSFIAAMFLVALPNTVFLLLISVINKKNRIFYKVKFLLLEILLLLLCYKVVEWSINKIPQRYRFDVTSSSIRIKSYFASPFTEVYSYLILFIILFCMRKIIGNRFNESEEK